MTEAATTRPISKEEHEYSNDIHPIGYDMATLDLMMKERQRGELAVLQAVNAFAKEPYKNVKSKQRTQNKIKNAGLYASFVLLLFTTMILFMSPMVNQTKFAFTDWRVWGVAALMFTVAFAVAYVIDHGRSNILDKSNNSRKDWLLYIGFGLASVIISTTGLMALADFYESTQQSTTTKAINDARQFVAAHGHLKGVTEADINAKRKPFLDLFALRGSGYGTSDKLRDMTRIDQELLDLATYKNAEQLLKGRHKVKNTADSSNWLFNTYAAILNSGVKLAAVIVGLAFNAITEGMMLVSHSRLIKLNARLEVTEQQWAAATMAANESMIVADSTIVALNHNDVFAHNFKMPFHILNQYQNNGKRYGDFIDVPVEDLGDDVGKSNQQTLTLDLYSLEELEAKHAEAKDTRRGESVLCPSCDTSFSNQSGFDVFCCPEHNRAYHNHVRRERRRLAG